MSKALFIRIVMALYVALTATTITAGVMCLSAGEEAGAGFEFGLALISAGLFALNWRNLIRLRVRS